MHCYGSRLLESTRPDIVGHISRDVHVAGTRRDVLVNIQSTGQVLTGISSSATHECAHAATRLIKAVSGVTWSMLMTGH